MKKPDVVWNTTGTSVSAAELDRELNALATIIYALRPLNDAERERVLRYCSERFGE